MDTRRNRAPRIARTFWLSSLLILTLAGWVKRVAWWLNSLYELQLRTIQASPRVFCDETPMPVLDPGRGRTRTCQFWAHAMDDRPWSGPSPPAVAYVFAASRGTDE